MDYPRGRLCADAGRVRHYRLWHGLLRFLFLRHDVAKQQLRLFGHVRLGRLWLVRFEQHHDLPWQQLRFFQHNAWLKRQQRQRHGIALIQWR